MNLSKFYLLLFISFFLSCSSDEHSPEIAFYFWKTVFKLSETERAALQVNRVKSLYVRYFDVDLNPSDKKPYPLSTIQFIENPAPYKVIPVVYIRNQVMLQKNSDNKTLVAYILSYIDQINQSNHISCSEIQIDCDWTLNSRDNFMEFMEILKQTSKMEISVTIRLHQVKYYNKTKIPKADYGVLMYYNMGRIAPDSFNSIYDRDIALRYIQSLKYYPMKLDVALPVFSQGVQIEQNRVVNLLSKVNQKGFECDSSFRQISSGRFLVQKSNLKFGNYFKQNNEVKIETISFENLKEMTDDLKDFIAYKPSKIIFFDLDSINLINYQHENQNFTKIASGF